MLAASCGQDSAPSLGERLEGVQTDLFEGATGEDVHAVNDFLAQYGYFPNSELAQQYSRWRPLVSERPANVSVFDAKTTDAVRQYQAHLGLQVTGIVDGATRTMMRATRCPVPEGMMPLDPADKFALFTKWNKTSLSWHLNNTDDVTMQQAHDAALAALATWAATTNISFNELSSTSADIQITFRTIDNAGGSLACTHNPGNTSGCGLPGDAGDINVDTAETWTTTIGATGASWDLQAVLTHELGHSIGLDHSSFSGAIMFPNAQGNRSLTTDDKVSASVLYDTYVQVPGPGGPVKDIGVGADGSVWVIGPNAFDDGFQIYKMSGSIASPTWNGDSRGALRISVDPNGIPWTVGASGGIRTRNTTNPFTGGWISRPGLAKDIGVGADGSVWVIGTNARPGGFGIYKWNGSTWIADASQGAAVKIAVGPNGIPWVINDARNFFRYSTNDPLTGSWLHPTGVSTDLAIGLGNSPPGPSDPDVGYVWSVGPIGTTGPANISVWDEQPFCNCGGNNAPMELQWSPGSRMGAGGVNEAIAVGPNGRPWLVDNNGTIFTSSK
jgi:Matrixin/Putative peptidoglycan binding domain